MHRCLSLAAPILFALTGGAQATSSISCQSAEGATIHLGIGNVPGLAVISATIATGGQTLSIADGDLAVAQAFADAESIRIDFTDSNIMDHMARLRLFRADEADDYVMAGTLEVTGAGAWAVICEGP